MKKIIYTSLFLQSLLCTNLEAQNCLNYLTANSDIPNNVTWGVYIDDMDRKWVSSSSGVSVFNNQSWQTFNVANSGFPVDFCREVTTTSNGDVWVGSVFSGVYRKNSQGWTFYNVSNSNLPSNTIYDIFTDSNDKVWICTDLGVAMFNGTNWILFNTSNVSSFPSPVVKDLDETSTQKLLLSTEPAGNWLGGLGEMLNGTMSTVHRQSLIGGIVSNTVTSSVETITGGIIGGTDNGVSIFENNIWGTFNMNNSTLPSNTITDVEIYYGDTSRIWISTDAGMTSFNLKTKVWETAITTANSCMNTNNINDLEIDQYGNVWFTGVQGGLMVFNRNRIVGSPITALEKVEDKDLIVFPNPAKDRIHSSDFKNREIEIFNQLGTKVLDGILGSEGLSLTELSKGIYFYSIEKGDLNKFLID